MQKNPIPESGNTDSQGWDLIIYKDTDQKTVILTSNSTKCVFINNVFTCILRIWR